MIYKSIKICIFYWTKNKTALFLLIAFLFLHSFLISSTPYIFSLATENLLHRKDIALSFVVLLIISYIGSYFFRAAATRIWNLIELNNIEQLVQDLYKKVMTAEPLYLEKNNVGPILRALSHGYNAYHQFGELVFQRLVITFFVAIITVIFGFIKSPIVGVLFLLSFTIYGAASMVYAYKAVFPKRLAAAKVDKKLSAEIADSLFNLSFIRISGREAAEQKRLEGFLYDWKSAFSRSWLANVTAEMIQEGILLLVKCIFIFTSAYSILYGHASPSTFVFFVSAFFVIESKMNDLARIFQQLMRSIADVETLCEIMELPEERQLGDGRQTESKKEGCPIIDIKNVDFSYSDSVNVFKSVSVSIKKGESVAIVGPSGAGKTTLINLLLGICKPKSGQILVHGMDIAQRNPRAHRCQIAVVPQEITVFDRTIEDNVQFLNDKTEDQIFENAIFNSNLGELFTQNNLTPNAGVGNRGSSLSVGQRQRLAIARAIASGRDLLLLDEATSALDVYNEKIVLDRILARPSQRTTLLVTHRLAALQNVDRVIVVRDNQLVVFDDPRDFLENHLDMVTSTAEDKVAENAE